MTRDEFVNDVTTWWELKDFCMEYDCSVMDDFFDSDYLDEYLDREIEDWARNMSWTSLRDKLGEIDTGYEWYYWDEYGDIEVADGDDFHYYKEDYRETTNKPSQSSTVYNIVEWVQYRSK